MKLTKNIALQEFKKRIKEFRIHFGLSQEDMGKFIGVDRNVYNRIETGSKNIDLNEADLIANIFGLRHYQLANPQQTKPELTSLPFPTLRLINLRKIRGSELPDYEKDIAGNLDKIIFETDFLHVLRSAEEIRLKFPDNIRDTIKSGRITDLLGKLPRMEKVQKIQGKEWGGNVNKYVLKTHYKAGD